MSARFSHRKTVSMSKPASFRQEKRDTVIILVQGFVKMSSCFKALVTNTVAVLALFDQEKAQLPAIQINEQPRLLTKSKLNNGSYKFSKYFS